ncbi:uncharacterized protein LOC126833258 isoform X2 [Adelges cooleyi]|nr:uncharacterized protein LOC126833258 isoform X2 [Adelges cooleyi]XP_050420433.1 uncharacterized protein LOC126833258 isoform X2 [Adelges cooleyi]XP_050420434.1 uncharacterized protein LOC126833258 isoform X2 [Adelges cooleyi]XP_050420435.1 uncharacterized protein LOC126833258 isoform X2 [Adelges cooleyi]XP_050420436.1 uncharacterized protein LOC126833258 isoform X2 [Adelges cooleyi]
MKVQYFVATTFIWLVSWTAALDIPYEDLNNPNNETDDNSESTIPLPDYDMFNMTASPMEMDTLDLNDGVLKRTDTNLVCTKKFVVNGRTLEHCYGDEHCRSYGDCCRDSAFYNEREQSAAMSRFGCYNVPNTDLVVKVVGRCPSRAYLTARQLANRQLCETNGGDGAEELSIGAYPATGTSSNLTYRNAYCAKCNGEPNVVYWKPLFKCLAPAASQLPDRTARLENASDQILLYHERRWYLADYDNKVIYSCKIQLSADVPVPPLRHCSSDGLLVNDCPAGNNLGPLAETCKSSANEVYEFNATGTGRTFRNAACALCNNVSIARLTCVPKPPLRSVYPDLKQLFNVKLQPCTPDEIYDVSAAKCRSIMRESGACSESFMLSLGEFDRSSFTNGTVYVFAYKKRLEYAPTNGTDILVCVDNLKLLWSEEPVYAAFLSYVSVTCSALSALSLIAHLSLFAADAEPKNLPEKNLASLCLSLLLGYVSWLSIAVGAVPKGKTSCVVSALMMQFGFLASFAWMSVMATDVWIVLYASTKKLRLVGGKRNKRFAAYSAFAWLTPAAFTTFAAALQWSSTVYEFVPQLKPNFQHTCWFLNPESLIALFVLPAGVTIVTNYVTFISAIRLIAASANGVSFAADTAVNRSRKNMKIYGRLSLMMGLTWAIGLVGAFYDHDVVWALYTVLNSLQGAFIFLAFEYSHSALRLLFPKPAVYSETQSSGVTPLSAST